MVLTDKKIRELVNEKALIQPYKEENMQSESYDLMIGNEVVVFKKEIRCIDIAEQKTIDDIYETINIGTDGYIISPKQYILVALKETISLPENITAHIRPKTSYTRLGLLVSPQHCNSTYAGHLRLGLFNATDYPILIRPDYAIAQIVFEELQDIPSEDKQYRNKKDAHYQNENGEFRGAKFDKKLIDDLMKEMFK